MNNAGLALGLEPVYHASLDDWDNMVATNVTRAHPPDARSSARHGRAQPRFHIVNIGSVAANYPYPGRPRLRRHQGLREEQFTLNLKADLAGTNVRVTDIEPGLVGGTEFQPGALPRRHGESGESL